MSITPSAIDPRQGATPMETPYAQVDPAEKLRKRVYTGFAASVGIVLVIAVCYVAGRIFTQPPNPARSVATAKVTPPVAAPVHAPPPLRIQTLAPPPAVPLPVVAKASEPPKPQPQSIPAPKPEKPIPLPAAQQAWTTVTPHTGETYLQVIALGGRFVQSYVNGLRAKGLHPLVAVSPMDDVYRILFGPFKNRQAQNDDRKELEAAGLQPMLQVY